MVGDDALFQGAYNGQRVLLTGHTGFKGSWLSLWLHQLGADVSGYSLAPPTEPNHYDLLKLPVHSILANVLDRHELGRTFSAVRPTIVFHLAAQSIVAESYKDPLGTIETNTLGTLNLLEQCRHCKETKAVVIVTSDKCYENDDQDVFRKEDDRLGGSDPYSVSKACAELISKTYQNHFSRHAAGSGSLLIATARSGNVIGGGDWAARRIVPDIMRAIYEGESLRFRHPQATRPWQHVLSPLYGYLKLGQGLLSGDEALQGAWNFGPAEDSYVSVEQISGIIDKIKPFLTRTTAAQTEFFEHHVLKLYCGKAVSSLGWRPTWNLEDSLSKTVEWFEYYYQRGEIISMKQLNQFIDSVKKAELERSSAD
jgi:CDP-glucose 4,6-dehydratase